MEDKITLKWQGLLVGGLPPKDPEAMANLPSFIGSIQQFIVNKINYFELAKVSTKGCKYLFSFEYSIGIIFFSTSYY